MNESLGNAYLGPRYGKQIKVYRRAQRAYGTYGERMERQRLAQEYDDAQIEARDKAEAASRALWEARKAALIKAIQGVKDGAVAGVQAAAGAVAKGAGILGAGAVFLGGKAKAAYNAGTKKVEDAYKGLRALSLKRKTTNFFLGKKVLTEQERKVAERFKLNPNSTEFRKLLPKMRQGNASAQKLGREGGVAGKVASLSRKAAAGLQQAKAALGSGAGKVANFVMGKTGSGRRQTFRQRLGNVGAGLYGLGQGVASRVGALFGKRGGTSQAAVAAGTAAVAAASAHKVAKISGSPQAATAAVSAEKAAVEAAGAAAAAGAPPSMMNRLRAFGRGVTNRARAFGRGVTNRASNIYQAGRNIVRHGRIRGKRERETSLQKRQGSALRKAEAGLVRAENANVAEKVAALAPPRGMLGRLYNRVAGLFTRKSASRSGSRSSPARSSSGSPGSGSRSGGPGATKPKGFFSRAYSGLKRGLGLKTNNVLGVKDLRAAADLPQKRSPTEHLIANLVAKQTNKKGLSAARREGAFMSAAAENEEQKRFISNRAQSARQKSMYRKGGVTPPRAQSVKSSNDIIASMMRK